jgi:hypothetical protein
MESLGTKPGTVDSHDQQPAPNRIAGAAWLLLVVVGLRSLSPGRNGRTLEQWLYAMGPALLHENRRKKKILPGKSPTASQSGFSSKKPRVKN